MGTVAARLAGGALAELACARRAPCELVWDGQWLQWQGRRYQLDKKSRILPGVLRLALCPDPQESGAVSPRQLWLFSDALPPEHYRLLARAIHFLPSRR
ncbi:protein YgfX [Aeromonas veronii]